jgi:hypothetical protein
VRSLAPGCVHESTRPPRPRDNRLPLPERWRACWGGPLRGALCCGGASAARPPGWQAAKRRRPRQVGEREGRVGGPLPRSCACQQQRPVRIHSLQVLPPGLHYGKWCFAYDAHIMSRPSSACEASNTSLPAPVSTRLLPLPPAQLPGAALRSANGGVRARPQRPPPPPPPRPATPQRVLSLAALEPTGLAPGRRLQPRGSRRPVAAAGQRRGRRSQGQSAPRCLNPQAMAGPRCPALGRRQAAPGARVGTPAPGRAQRGRRRWRRPWPPAPAKCPLRWLRALARSSAARMLQGSASRREAAWAMAAGPPAAAQRGFRCAA